MENNGVELPDGLGTGLVSSQTNPTIINNGGAGGGQGSKYTNQGDTAAQAAAAKAEQDRVAKEAADAAAKKAADDAAEAAKLKTLEDAKTKQIDIDGVIFQLDEKGNAVDKDGKVFKTADEIKTLLESQEEEPLINDIIKQAGVELKDDKGKPIVFEDSVEGVIKFTNALAEHKAVELFNKNIEADEELKKFIEFRQRGGTLQEYAQRESQSWQKVKLDENNEAQQLDIVVQDLMMSGIDEAQAKITAEMYKETKRLKDFSTNALKRLQKFEADTEKEEKEEFENHQKQVAEQRKKYWDNVDGIIKTGKIGAFTIPENLREPFFKYMAVAVKDGKSQAMIDEAESVERLLELRLAQFMKFDFSKLITNAANTLKVNTLRNRVKVHQNMDGGQGINKDNYGKSTVDNFPSLDKLTA